MGTACCSEGGRCHERWAASVKDEIGCSPQVPDDGVWVGSPAAAAPTGRSKHRKPVALSSLVGSARAVQENLTSQTSDSEDEANIPGSVASFVPELQMHEAKSAIRKFVRGMTEGKAVAVLAPSGDLDKCSLSLSRNLYTLKIRQGSWSKSIAMKDVHEIHAVTDIDGIVEPLDELCATVILTSGNAISFRMADIQERDTFIESMTALANWQRYR